MGLRGRGGRGGSQRVWGRGGRGRQGGAGTGAVGAVGTAPGPAVAEERGDGALEVHEEENESDGDYGDDDVGCDDVGDAEGSDDEGEHDDVAEVSDEEDESDEGCCIICLDDIQKQSAVWSCQQCFCMFHLQCIQSWAHNGVKQPTTLSDELFPDKKLVWLCPKCRKEYDKENTPMTYICFCGKVRDPPFDPWITPHSCGEVCGRELQPPCGHTCPQLCHPGACPPCPKMVHNATCFCGQTKETRRCAGRYFSCGKVCNRLLNCGRHRCAEPCHKGKCSPCAATRTQSCTCGTQTATIPCGQALWQCDQPCGKPLACGHHNCSVVCHTGECPPCPRSLERTCPCGKEKHQLPCTKDVPTCGATCGKRLSCGKHTCPRPCHQGDCGPCNIAVDKRCFCGASTKTLPCSQSFTCNSRCGRMRTCGRHRCRKRCCAGQCPPCPEVCGRRLNCGNHTCKSPCHPGPCYPCTVRRRVSCGCGRTVVRVPCGREKRTARPPCSLPCPRLPYCRHPSQQSHTCHTGPCPSCTQTCGQLLSCGHTCTAPCHDERPILESDGAKKKKQKKKNKKGRNHSRSEQDEVTPRPTPCPPCNAPVERACVGLHEVKGMKCHESLPFSCNRACGRMMACGQHCCGRTCHLPLSEGARWADVDAALRTAFGKSAGTPEAGSNVYTMGEEGAGGSKQLQQRREEGATEASSDHEPARGDAALAYGAAMIGRGCGTCRRPCSRLRPKGCTHSCALGVCHQGECPKCEETISVSCHCGATSFKVQCHERTGGGEGAEDWGERRCCGGRCPRRMTCGHRCVASCHAGNCAASSECTKSVRIRCPCRSRKKELSCPQYQQLHNEGLSDEDIVPCDPKTCKLKQTTSLSASASAAGTKKSDKGQGKGSAKAPSTATSDAKQNEAVQQRQQQQQQQQQQQKKKKKGYDRTRRDKQSQWQRSPTLLLAIGGGVVAALLAVALTFLWS